MTTKSLWAWPTSCSKNSAFSCPLDQKSMAYASSFIETILILRKFPTNTTLSIFWKKKKHTKTIKPWLKTAFSKDSMLCAWLSMSPLSQCLYWTISASPKSKLNQQSTPQNRRVRFWLGYAGFLVNVTQTRISWEEEPQPRCLHQTGL